MFRTVKRKVATTLILALVAGALGVAPSAASTTLQIPTSVGGALDGETVTERLVVTYTESASANEQVQALAEADVELVATASASNTVIVQADNIAASVDTLRRDPAVLAVEEDTLLTETSDLVKVPDATQTSASNDPQTISGAAGWSLAGRRLVGGVPAAPFGTNAATAWDADVTGSSDVYVAVLDSGVEITHPDLVDNIFTNPGETPGNGIDDDGNGKVDDVHGWNFNDNNNQVQAAGDSHGTNVAGIIGAVGGNGLGVAGINWDVGIIPVKFLSGSTGSTGAAVLGIDYVIDLKKRHGLNIVAINNSYGGKSYSQALERAMVRAGEAGIAMVTAAGNKGTDNDTTPHYPASYTCRSWYMYAFECNVAVAAHERNGNLVAYSWWGTNYGVTSVDLSAPGDAVMTTGLGGGYELFAGTSAAAPHVAGAFALCASAAPRLPVATIRELLLQAATPTPSAQGKVATGGMLNVGRLVATCRDHAASSPVLGQWETVAAGPGTVTVGGWARFKSSDASVRVRIDGEPAEAVAARLSPTAPTSAAYPSFNLTVPAGDGLREVCVYAGDVALGCQMLRTFSTSSPVLEVTSVATADGQWWEVSGWALDPDAPTEPVTVSLTLNGSPQETTLASLPLASAASVLPGWTNMAAFSAYVSTDGIPSGIRQMCANVTNVGPGAAATQCKPLYVTNRAEPLGAFDAVSLVAPSSVRVRGWTFDPNVSGSPSEVLVTVDGRAVSTVLTGAVRADVERAFPSYGLHNGFDAEVQIPARSGSRQVCATAINKSQGTAGTSLGCKTVVTRSGNPFGNFETASANPERTLSMSGWALDPDTVASTTLHVYVDRYFVGTLETTGTRRDVARVYPTYGSVRGFSGSFALKRTGSRRVCVFALNAGLGTANTLLGCRNVVIR